MNPKADVQTDCELAARCAAIASAGAGLIHFAVMPAHWLEWVPSGLFFAVVAVLQLLWGFLVWSRPRPVLLAAGLAGNAGIAALWVASRTVGLPFGGHAGSAEAVDAAGICVLLLECYVVMGAGWAWIQDFEPESVSRLRSALVMVGANGVIVGTVFVGVASGFQGHPDQPHPSEAQSGTGAEVPHQHPAPQTSEPGGAGLPVTDMGLTDPGPEQGSLPGEHPHP